MNIFIHTTQESIILDWEETYTSLDKRMCMYAIIYINVSQKKSENLHFLFCKSAVIVSQIKMQSRRSKRLTSEMLPTLQYTDNHLSHQNESDSGWG